ncbi:MAG: hypothetical protein GY810_06395 [Aureispira sp.]|nr:hypothetical protein [Aureispira sp.]
MFGDRFSVQKDLIGAFYLLQSKYDLRLSEPSKGDNGLKIYGYRSEDQKQFSITLAHENNKIIGWTISAAGGRKIGAYITIQNKKKRPEKDVSSDVSGPTELPEFYKDGMLRQMPIDNLRLNIKKIDLEGLLNKESEDKEDEEQPKQEDVSSFYEQFYVDGHKGVYQGHRTLNDRLKRKIIERKELLDADQRLVIKNFGLEYTTTNIELPAELRIQIAWVLDLADCLDGKI